MFGRGKVEPGDPVTVFGASNICQTRDQKIDGTEASDDEVKTCGYCMDVFVDPKKLPCGHAFCLSCLKGDFMSRNTTDTHTCIKCRKTHAIRNLDELPGLAKPTTSATISTAVTTKVKCDICQKWEPAVSYCIDCEKKICSHHEKHHNGYFEKTHMTVSITEYHVNPKAYKTKKLSCDQHNKQAITMACKICFQFNCEECHRQKERCEKSHSLPVYSSTPAKTKTSEKGHTYETLDAVEQQVRSKLEELRQNVSSKIDSLATAEKNAYKKMDSIEEKCKKMKLEVKTKTDEQVLRKNILTNVVIATRV
ncbi:hypothetical protein EB796_002652 [Bugula neritina]|uniref:RING-type domain-containing protein n=1 Tax=Bugula neritina TaxID=10212 RepID=A0A7J7KL01_BUGNE|nr:hypothetical protein EB796_002652 [Bugula neritina]